MITDTVDYQAMKTTQKVNGFAVKYVVVSLISADCINVSVGSTLLYVVHVGNQ